jgi:hypothetical protein
MVKLLTDPLHDGELTLLGYFRTSKEFCNTALYCFEAWNKHNEDLLKLSCLLLDKVPTRKYFDKVIDLQSSECEVLTVNPDEPFDDCTYLSGYLSQEESEWFSSNPPFKKWSEVCVHLKENNISHGNMKKVIELLLCLPGSNAFNGRVFSRMNYIWSQEKSRFRVDTIQTILVVKTNTDLSCEAFSEKLASNPGALKKVHSLHKYDAIARTYSSE